MGFHDSIKRWRGDDYFGDVELKLCRKCGSQRLSIEGCFDELRHVYVQCKNCKKRGPKKINKELASMFWNKQQRKITHG